MSTKGEAFAGLSVAITTPFKNGEIDFAKLREQMEFQIAAGTVCVVGEMVKRHGGTKHVAATPPPSIARTPSERRSDGRTG